jgi:hypothetical protein
MELKIDGKWWLPTDNVQHPGTLKYDDDGVFLTISGPFLPFVEIYSTIDKKDFIRGIGRRKESYPYRIQYV